MLRSKYLKTVESNKDKAHSLEMEIVESDVELDDSDVVEPDYDPPLQMGDPSVEVSGDDREDALVQKLKATDDLTSSEKFLSSASMFGKLKKPNAAIRDADAALKVETNRKKIAEHRQKYEKLHIAREQRRAELERLRKMKVFILEDGQVIRVASAKDLKIKLNAAAKTSRLAIWCVHIGPVYTKLASKYPKSVFFKVDIDEARETAAE